MSSGSIPHIRSDVPNDVRTFADRVRERLSEEAKKNYVTAKELEEALRKLRDELTAVKSVTEKVLTIPRPVNFAGAVVGTTHNLTWDAPTYEGHQLTEIWAAQNASIDVAEKIGTSQGTSYDHAVGEKQDWYYWARFANTKGETGPWSSDGGLFVGDGVMEPTAPTGLSAVGKLDGIQISWDAPVYLGHAVTEIWYASELTADGSAQQSVLSGTTSANTYGHSVPIEMLIPGESETGYAPPDLGLGQSDGSLEPLNTDAQIVTQYFWLRHVNVNGVRGPWSEMLEAQTDPNGGWLVPPWVKEWLNSLGTQVAIINGPEDIANSMLARLKDLQAEIHDIIDDVRGIIDGLEDGLTDIVSPTDGGWQGLWALKTTAGDNAAAIVSLREVFASAEEAWARTIDALDARVDGNSASILDLREVFADAEEAWARTIDALDARVDGNSASIIDEQYVRATANSALATQFNTQISELSSGVYSSISDLSTTSADEDSALSERITTLDTNVPGIARAIANERITAAVGPYGVIGSRLTQVETKTDNNTNLVSSLQSAQSGYCVRGGAIDAGVDYNTCVSRGGYWYSDLPLSIILDQVSVSDGNQTGSVQQLMMVHRDDLDNLKSEWGVTVTNGGVVTGVSLLATGQSSAFNVRADRFTVSPYDWPGTPPFYVEGNTTYITNAVIKNLQTEDIGYQQISTSSYGYSSAPPLSDVTHGSIILAIATGKANGDVTLKCAGVEKTFNVILDDSGYASIPFSLIISTIAYSSTISASLSGHYTGTNVTLIAFKR